ncbi:hypothetical protein A2U01_0067973, partial [Trifolium medium]|nr:hypothetical protein [Trifolium medium]
MLLPMESPPSAATLNSARTSHPMAQASPPVRPNPLRAKERTRPPRENQKADSIAATVEKESNEANDCPIIAEKE